MISRMNKYIHCIFNFVIHVFFYCLFIKSCFINILLVFINISYDCNMFSYYYSKYGLFNIIIKRCISFSKQRHTMVKIKKYFLSLMI